MMARDTIAATIGTTTVGKEEPGAIRAFSLPGFAATHLFRETASPLAESQTRTTACKFGKREFFLNRHYNIGASRRTDVSQFYFFIT